MGKNDMVLIPGGLQLSLSVLKEMYDEPHCNVALLDDRQISVLLSLLDCIKWQWLWGLPNRQTWTPGQRQEWDEIEALISDAERALLMSCTLDDLTSELQQMNTTMVSMDAKLQTLERIPEATTLQEMLDQFDESDLTGDLADLVEIFSFLRDIMPSFAPNLSAGNLIDTIVQARFRESMLNLVEDITLSQRAQATAQYGLPMHGLYDIFDNVADYLLLPTGWLGRAVSIWRRLRPSQVSGWTSWVTYIGGIFSGTLLDAAYDQATNLDSVSSNLALIDQTISNLSAGQPCSVHNVVNCGACTGSSGDLEQEPGQEGGQPPGGTSPIDDGVPDRKCRAANMVYDDIHQILINFRDNPVAVDLFDMATLQVSLTPYTTSGTVFIGDQLPTVYGWAIDFAQLFLLNLAQLDFADMVSQWSSAQASIIDEMHVATDASDVVDDVFSHLAFSPAAEQLTAMFLINNVVNVLWFSVGASEAILNGYSAGYDCQAGPICYDFFMTTGIEILPNGQHLQSVPVSTQQVIRVNFDRQQDEVICGPGKTVTVTELVGSPNTVGNNGYRCYNTSNQIFYSSDDPPVGLSGVTNMYISSDSPSSPPSFEIRIDWS